ncbi:MAG: HU family DNA-binding protein [Leptospiraceae bacterium]|nr:HU family DNA-binding protein [Leptospiraceae bacterium]MDW8305678.1 HU family DNA-binding protein [Leptospiraceae bacterium]
MAKKEQKPLTKTQIIAALAEKTNLAKKEVAQLIEKLGELAYEETRRVGRFQLPGFGMLKLVQRQARIGRNPKTGEKIEIPAKKAVKFTLSKAAKEAILPPTK